MFLHRKRIKICKFIRPCDLRKIRGNVKPFQTFFEHQDDKGIPVQAFEIFPHGVNIKRKITKNVSGKIPVFRIIFNIPTIFFDVLRGIVFYDDNGMPLVAMHWQHRFNHMVGRYNDIYRVQMPNITLHVCRHTYCSNMAKPGMNPKTLQYLMGHSDISVTMNVYTHIGFDDAEEELKRIEEFRKARAEVEQKKEKPMSQKMFKVI